MKKTFLASIFSLLLFSTIGLVVYADIDVSNTAPIDISNPSNPKPGPAPIGINIKINNPLKCGNDCTLYKLAESIVNDIILPIGGILAVLAFVFSGFKYVTAGGNDSKIQSAHRALLYSAIGTAVLLGAWVFTQVIENTVNKIISS